MSIDPALVWFLLGFALALLELAVPGIILIFFGAGAWLVSITTWLGLTRTAESQLLIFAVTSLALLISLRRWVQSKFSGHVTGVQDLNCNLDEFTGRPVEVLADVVPGQAGGKVEFKGTTWTARAAEVIHKGDRAVIDRVDGITLIIRKNEEGV